MAVGTRRMAVGLTRRGTTCFSTVTGGRTSRPSFGRGGSRSGAWVDERCSPAVLDFLRSTYVGKAAPPVEENWGSDGRGGAARGVVTRVPLVFCLLCSFPFVFFDCLVSLSLVISLLRLFPLLHYLVNGLLPLSPTFGEGRQTGNGKKLVSNIGRVRWARKGIA